MKIGIIGDIHANLPALLAVLEALDKARVDRVLCAGDIVGYGAFPKECIALLQQLKIPAVRGNHDDYTTQPGADWRIQPEAKVVIRWTQKVLSAEQIAWLASLPRTLLFDDATLLHSSHAWWPRWPYVINEQSAIENFMFQSTRISFNAHSHVAVYASHREMKRPKLHLLRNMFLPRNQRLLIGVGSVGQPRDGDPRAAAVIYDTARQSVHLLRVAYDVEAAARQLAAAGLPEQLAQRLRTGR